MSVLQKAQMKDIIAILKEAEGLWNHFVDKIPDSHGDADFWEQIREVDRALPNARLNIESLQNLV
ncbi:hypothetical protein GCM10028803_04960 [Larkinella knui]|uniref:Uncharacterized protein n=1 Tax=Larkinella knui TaxID=2025310 RepID=A0A3P1CL67_9BACT|nr:hypothetical protein [Larkinella knui]RRB13826.1 hypothetical protein EHT87_16335 [Larkinella knui]